MSELESFVRDLISRYVAASITVDELNHLLPDGWDLDESGDPVTKELVLRTVGYIADHHRDMLSEDEIRRELAPEVSWHVARVFEAVSPPLASAPVETRVRVGGSRPPEVVPAS